MPKYHKSCLTVYFCVKTTLLTDFISNVPPQYVKKLRNMVLFEQYDKISL